MAFDAAERNGRFDLIQCQKSREQQQQQRKEKETSIPLQKDSGIQSNPNELSEN